MQGRAFPVSVQKGKVLKKQPRCAKQVDDVEHSYQLEVPELGTQFLVGMVFTIEGFHCITHNVCCEWETLPVRLLHLYPANEVHMYTLSPTLGGSC